MSVEDVKSIYEFGDFRFDTREKILTCNGENVEITPKGFELLSVFVENHGRLLHKDELMDKIWADSFVEESNLTFNIRQLRKALGDDAQNPRYIKTVRGHGYRFITEVHQVSESSKPEAAAVDTTEKIEIHPADKSAETGAVYAVADTLPKQKKRSHFPIFTVTATVLLAAVFIAGIWYLKDNLFNENGPNSSAPFISEKLSNSGKVLLAAISPDGKTVVYTSGSESEKQSLWIRQLDNGTNIEIIPESEERYIDLAFAPDGGTVYFSRRSRSIMTGAIYRISVFGGVPQKIVGDTLSSLGISPDGSRLVFNRFLPNTENPTKILVVDAVTGANEQEIATISKPYYTGDLDISADGKHVAVAIGLYKNGTTEYVLADFDLKTGTRRDLTTEQFTYITHIARLPAGGWLFTGSKMPVLNYRLWKISEAGGEAVALTQESEFYDGVSLNEDASKMISTQIRRDNHIRFLALENASFSPVELDGDTVDIAADGKIFYTSERAGTFEIWSSDTDGSNQRQLTNTKAEKDGPVVAPDGKTVFFSSVQTGKWQVWRMNTDGTDQTQVTHERGGFPLAVSPDGEWLYYHEHDDDWLWRISLRTGKEEVIIDKRTPFGYALSPDCSQVAYVARQDETSLYIQVTVLSDGSLVKVIPLSDYKNRRLLNILPISWSRDGKYLIYATNKGGMGNYVLWMHSLSDQEPRQIADLGSLPPSGLNMPLTPDGKFVAIAQGATMHDAVLLKGIR